MTLRIALYLASFRSPCRCRHRLRRTPWRKTRCGASAFWTWTHRRPRAFPPPTSSTFSAGSLNWDQEGRNYVIDARFADTDRSRLPALVKELVDRGADVIVTIGNAPVSAAKAATGRVPIVMAGSTDPVENRLVASLARPGGNVTGVTTTAGPAIAGKALQLDFLLTNRFPSMFQDGYLVERGGLLSYHTHWSELRRRAASYVDKIFKGANRQICQLNNQVDLNLSLI